MEQNSTEQVVKKLNAVKFTIDPNKGSLTHRVVKPQAGVEKVKFVIFEKRLGSLAEFTCNPEDALQVQALLVKLMEKTNYYFTDNFYD